MKIEETRNTPAVTLSRSECVFEITGPSFADNITNIYKSVLEWIEKEIPAIECELNCVFKFDVLNSVSYKNIIEIIMRLTHFVKTGKKINIHWYYYKNDEDNYDVGKDISELFNIPFKLIKF